MSPNRCRHQPVILVIETEPLLREQALYHPPGGIWHSPISAIGVVRKFRDEKEALTDRNTAVPISRVALERDASDCAAYRLVEQ